MGITNKEFDMDVEMVRNNFKTTYKVPLENDLVYALLKLVVARKADKWNFNVTKSYVTAEFRDIDDIKKFVETYEEEVRNGLLAAEKNRESIGRNESDVKQSDSDKKANAKPSATVKKRS